MADIWSCGVILFVLMAGYVPFNEADLKTLYDKVDCIPSSSLQVATICKGIAFIFKLDIVHHFNEV